ncbi:hypothetical protein [uncultured Clostridium sp.]|uniref:hypothetical protein n=1 Tax=uncultured Clostridium sp. TaxID=59620 RepID=UPI0025FA2C93|nr:hypothetical protein [uncultured Clostridium sp.]
MSIRKTVILFIGAVCVFTFCMGCNDAGIGKHSQNNSFDISEESEIKKLEDMSKDEKIEIGRNLFDEYINENRTDWKMVKSQNLNRQPVVCLTDYKINDVDFVKEEKDKFTLDISYDIQYTDESNFWVAGNGELADDNWVVNKCSFVDIEQVGDKYFIVNVYTG